jgi:hypothetical protein
MARRRACSPVGSRDPPWDMLNPCTFRTPSMGRFECPSRLDVDDRCASRSGSGSVARYPQHLGRRRGPPWYRVLRLEAAFVLEQLSEVCATARNARVGFDELTPRETRAKYLLEVNVPVSEDAQSGESVASTALWTFVAPWKDRVLLDEMACLLSR